MGLLAFFAAIPTFVLIQCTGTQDVLFTHRLYLMGGIPLCPTRLVAKTHAVPITWDHQTAACAPKKVKLSITAHRHPKWCVLDISVFRFLYALKTLTVTRVTIPLPFVPLKR